VTAEAVSLARGMVDVAEGSPAIPAVLLRVLAVHLAAFVDLDLVLNQLGIVVQLLQLDVPEKFLEATYGRLLMRRCRHRAILAERKRSPDEKLIREGETARDPPMTPAVPLDWYLLFNLAAAQTPRSAHAPHNWTLVCRNSFGLSRPLTFTATRMLISSQEHLSTPISQDVS